MQETITITIPTTLIHKGDLVVIPRREYETLRVLNMIREFTPSLAQRKALLRAERNLEQGKTLSYHALATKLGIAY